MTRGRIVHLRGPSGGGKTTLTRALMSNLGSPTRVNLKDDPGRRRPMLLAFPRHKLAVMGHYDVLCGGADTIKSAERIFEVARRVADEGMNLFMEGLLIMPEFHRSVALARDGYDYHNVFLLPPMEECLRNVEARRAAQGKEPKEQKQMADFYPRVMRTWHRLSGAGLENLTVCKGTTTEAGAAALAKVRELLGLSA